MYSTTPFINLPGKSPRRECVRILSVMILLASNSPRRKQLLELSGWPYQVLSLAVDESTQPQENPQEYVLRLAEAKARAAADLGGQEFSGDEVIVAADTAVVLDGEILGKPGQAQEAQQMLHRLAGGSHLVMTGLFAMRRVDGRQVSAVCTSQVEMRRYDDTEIDNYIATGDPLDKAGAYAIQHPIFHPVQAVHGCYPNVVGLPMCTLKRLLDQMDCSLQERPARDCQPDTTIPCHYYRQLASLESNV